MSDVVEVVIVGAGPAGAIAAYHLARAGRRVCLLERERLPRYKPCGGGVTLKAIRELPFPVDAVVERDVDRAEIWYGADRVIRIADAQIGRMVMRSAFDEHLIGQAVLAGAQLRQSVTARGVRPDRDGHVAIDTSDGRLRARCVIGADGANSIVAKSNGLGPWRRWGVAIEAEIDPPAGAEVRPSVVFDFRAVPGGYAYVFPKARHYSVGVYTTRPSLPQLRARLDEYIRRTPAVRDGVVRSVVGHRVPLGRVAGPLQHGGVLLVGDAAGLGEPLWGEGIYCALRSGRIAAAVIDGALGRCEDGRLPDLRAYDRQVRREVAGDLMYARAFAALFYRFARGRAASLARDPILAEGMMDILRGRCSYRRFIPMVLQRLPAILASKLTT